MKRQRMEIMTQILMLCRTPARKTRIMYQINLSYAQLKSYLTLLKSQGLLAHNSPKYTTTDKGLRFLEAFANLSNVLEDGTTSSLEEFISESYREIRIIRRGTKTVVQGSDTSARKLRKTEDQMRTELE